MAHFYEEFEIDNSEVLFTNFLKLPPKLRTKIWGLALPCRLITITLKLNAENMTGEVEITTEEIHFLSVCRES